MNWYGLGIGALGCLIIIAFTGWIMDWALTLMFIQNRRIREFAFTTAGFFTAVAIFGAILYGE